MVLSLPACLQLWSITVVLFACLHVSNGRYPPKTLESDFLRDLEIAIKELDITSDVVENALDEGLDELKRTKIKRKHYMENDVDGQRRTSRILNRMLRRLNEAEQKVDLGEVLLAATKKLATRTGLTVDELRRDPDVKKYCKNFRASVLQKIADIESNIAMENRRKRQTPDDPCEPDIDCSGNSISTFRTFDGTCNNANHKAWGSTLTTEPRWMDPVYSDGVSAPRLAINGGDLPSARDITNRLFQSPDTSDEAFNTLISFNWGQFLDHDIVLTPISTGNRGTSITCCDENDTPIDRTECLPIIIPDVDPHFTTTCMPFTRSAPVPNDECNIGPKQTMNQISSFIDASNVYGSTRQERNSLRVTGTPYLETKELADNTFMLPEGESDSCTLPDPNPDENYCQKTGDTRGNVQPGLSHLHLAFVREHNRIAENLSSLNTGWGANRVFNNARKIVGALMQQITYGEYLHNVVNEEFRTLYDLDLESTGFANIYNDTINPGIYNAFAAAAFRFGHSQIPPELAYRTDNGDVYDNTNMEEAIDNPHMIQDGQGSKVKDLTNYMVERNAKRVDRAFENAIRNTLFGSLDLPALNIQRGRDHGLPPYVDWLKELGLVNQDITDFAELPFHGDNLKNQLQNIYNDVRDIDLYVGGMTETRIPPVSYVGPTFAHLISKQFEILKKGDSFWYENSGTRGFTEEQLAEIRKVKLSKILCNNFEIIEVQPNVFRRPVNQNAPVACETLDDMNFSPWAN